MKGYIIDDEEAPRLTLKHLLKQIEPEVEIVGEANSLLAGVEELKNCKVDVLFLDIEMPGNKGLDILQFIEDPVDFEIIFVTAYSEHAIQAFKLSAFDYLLKPLNINDLSFSLKRLRDKQTYFKNLGAGLDVLRKNLAHEEPKQYCLRTHREEIIISLDEIVSLEADGMYTDIVLTNEKITASKPMKEILSDLPETFFRSHRSYAVNLNFVELPIRLSSVGIKTKIGTYIPLSNRKKQEFTDAMRLNE